MNADLLRRKSIPIRLFFRAVVFLDDRRTVVLSDGDSGVAVIIQIADYHFAGGKVLLKNFAKRE